MADLLVRGLETRVVARLKEMARSHGRSLQGELKAILTESVLYSMKQALEVSAKWKRRLTGKKFSDSTDLIREDRDR